MSHRNRRRSNRSNVRTLPTSKTQSYWADRRSAPRYVDNADLFRGPYTLQDLYKSPPLVGWDYVDLGVFTQDQINQFRREEGRPILDPRDRKYGPRVIRGINVNVPMPVSPARYGPRRMFATGVVAAAALGAGQDRKEPVPVCEERRVRKQVMFATGKSGQVGQKSPVWTRKSRLVCK